MRIPEWGCLAVIIAVVLAAVAIVCWQRVKTRRVFQNIHTMLDAAIDGSFTERTFDETLPAAVESKLGNYLSASAVSSRNLAAEKDKIKELIADISHQTKTPVANILLYAQLLGEQGLPEKGRACVEALQNQAEKLNFLIASLVKLSRLEAGILALRPVKAALRPVLDDVHGQLGPKAAEKGVALSFASTEVTALFDPRWTVEALANIVDNAIKYTPPGGAVSVGVTPYDLFCRIDVTDTGAGIAEDELPRVFARFYRSPAHSAEEGVGIGLYLARQILAEQGGYIKVSSAPGRGSTFSIFLPNPVKR
jgi:signal transduction histidine kinase